MTLEQLQAYWSTVKALDLKPRQVQFAVDDLVYTSTKLPASEGIELGPRFAVIAGQTVVDGALDASAILRALERLISEGTGAMIRALLKQTQCESLAGGPGGMVIPKFDDHFAGEYPHLMRVVMFVGAHNFLGPTRGVL